MKDLKVLVGKSGLFQQTGWKEIESNNNLRNGAELNKSNKNNNNLRSTPERCKTNEIKNNLTSTCEVSKSTKIELKSHLGNNSEVDKTMTIREISDVLDIGIRTIQIKVKELFPDKISERDTTRLNESEVYLLKSICEKKFAVEMKEDRKQILKKAFEILNDENEELRSKILIDAPKVEVYNSYLSADNFQTMNEAAHVLNIGRNILFKILRDKKIFQNTNIPYQKFMDKGYFKVIEKPVKIGDKMENKPQTFINSKGIEFINNILKDLKGE